jgi:hypothetical protein
MCVGLQKAIRCLRVNHIGKTPGKRWTHRAPDLVFFNEGVKKNKHFENQVGNAIDKMQEFPKLISNYFKVATAATLKGKTPFVHAQAAMWSVPRLFTRELNRNFYTKYPFHHSLRPNSDKDYQCDRKEIEEKIKVFCQNNGDHGWTPGTWDRSPSRCDMDPNIRKFLISMNYALLGNVSTMESAYYFAFEGSKMRDDEHPWKIAEEVFRRSLQMRGTQNQDRVIEELKDVFQNYEQLNAGNLLVIALPKEKLKSFAYDSKSYGIPTGRNIEEVASQPMRYSSHLSGEEGGLQARLMIHRDTMAPTSGIDVVCVNEDEEVDLYCKGFQITPPDQVPEYASLFKQKRTAVEESERQTRRELRYAIKALGERVTKPITPPL